MNNSEKFWVGRARESGRSVGINVREMEGMSDVRKGQVWEMV